VLGTAASGRQALTLNPRQFPEQLIYAVNQAQAEALVFDPELAPLVEAMQLQMGSVKHYVQLGGPDELPPPSWGLAPMDAESLLGMDDPDWRWPQVDERSTALIAFRVASSGWPKGVPISHRACILQAMAAAFPDAYGIAHVDTLMPLLPVAHSGGWALCLCAALIGSQLTMVPPGLQTADLARAMIDTGVTIAAGPPTVWQALLDHLDAEKLTLPTLRCAAVGSASFPVALLERLRQRPGLDVVHTWGMTELAPPELVARGPWTMDAYLGEPDSPLIAVDGDPGWLPTGDIGRIGPDGRVTLTDRKKDLIRCGGEWISARQLERIALLHPQVSEAAVIAQADEVQGERPLLVVVARPGGAPDIDELLALFNGRVADWQRPVQALCFPEMPKLGNGDIDKRELRALVDTLL
jgi:fatty-acyl-CoA synthase